VHSILIALCVIVAGGPPRTLEVRDAHSAQLEPAPQAVLTASSTRRAGIDAFTRALWLIPSASPIADAPPRAVSILLAERAPLAPVSSYVPTRSSRGPPRS
jgi:hypothetical protein